MFSSIGSRFAPGAESISPGAGRDSWWRPESASSRFVIGLANWPLRLTTSKLAFAFKGGGFSGYSQQVPTDLKGKVRFFRLPSSEFASHRANIYRCK